MALVETRLVMALSTAVLATMMVLPAHGQTKTLQGASAALKVMGYAQKPPAIKPIKKGEYGSFADQQSSIPKDPNAAAWKQFNASATAYASKAASMAPEEAAATWLRLLDRCFTLNEKSRSYGSEHGLSYLVEKLPPPPAWPALRSAMSKRPEQSKPRLRRREALLRLFTDVLTGNAASQSENIETVRATYTPEQIKQGATRMLDAYDLTLALRGTDPDRIERAMDRTGNASRPNFGSDYLEEIKVPALVTSLGAEHAEKILRKMFTRKVALAISDAKTAQLARRIAIELLPSLKAPQWTLVNGVDTDTVTLYEGLAKRFPKPSSNDYRRNEANQAVIWALAAIGRMDSAKKRFVSLVVGDGYIYPPRELDNSPPTPDWSLRVYTLLREVAIRYPQQANWAYLVSYAAQAEKSAEAATLVEQAAKKWPDAASARVTALLAADKISEAITLLRRDLKPGTKSEVLQPSATRIAQLGHALKRPDWEAEGIRAMRTLLPALIAKSKKESEWRRYDSFYGVATTFKELGYPADSERALIAALSIQPILSRRDDSLYSALSALQSLRQGNSETSHAATLARLVELYMDAGRPKDAIRLIDEAPLWGTVDLNNISSPNVGIANALRAAGRNTDALSMVRKVLSASPSLDSAYELLLSLLPPEKSRAELDRLAKLFPFEDRPLVWKAEVLKRKKDFVGAEAAARAAIAVDPSDGDQGKETRMRAYAILADALVGQGKAADARLYRNIVTAIRRGEAADELGELGLWKRAIAGYRQALTYFVDAYCVQSRLAIQLAEQGNIKEAEVHYRKAFELMPDSFGRMESHCFGCEGVFDGPLARRVAEEVFTRLIAEKPGRPQVSYLLGMLREAQGRHTEAIASFRKAVSLDPDYINAWRHMETAATQAGDYTAKSEAQLALLRLADKDTYIDTNEITDLATLWNVLQMKHDLPTMPTTPVRPAGTIAYANRLQAAIEAALRKGGINGLAAFEKRGYLDMDRSGLEEAEAPGVALTRHNLLQPLFELMEYSSMENVEYFGGGAGFRN